MIYFVFFGIAALSLDLIIDIGFIDGITYWLLISIASRRYKISSMNLLAGFYSILIILDLIIPADYSHMQVVTHIYGMFTLWLLTFFLSNAQDRKEKEMTLRKHLQNVYDAVDEIIFGLDKNYRVTYKNKAADKMGYSFINLGDDFFEKLPDTRGTPLELNLRKAMESGVPVNFTYETKYSHTPRILNFSASPYQEGLSVYTKDVTEIVTATKRAEAAEQYLNHIINRMDDAFWALDQNFNFLYANDKTLEWAGKSREEIINKSFWEIFPLLKGTIMEEKFSESLRTGHSMKFEMKALYPENIYLSLSISPSSEGLTVFAQDITDYRDKKIRIENMLNEREVLFKELHHRIKNNLQLISSMISLESQRIEDKKSRYALEKMITRINSISMVHSELHETGQVSHIEASQYLRDLISLLISSYEARTVEINLQFNEMFLHIKYAIPLGMILNELMTNSIKYGVTREGKCIIDVSLSKKKSEVRLAVRDCGIGYPEPIDENRLGLQIIRHFTQQLNADLKIENRGGAYTEVRFSVLSHEEFIS